VRPTLRPGLRLLRRDRAALQLGFEWPGLATVRDTPAIRAVLHCVDGFRGPDGVVLAAIEAGHGRRACEEALAALIECGAVVDADTPRDRAVPEPSWAAWWLLAGPLKRADDVAHARLRRTVTIAGSGSVAEQVRRLLPASHVRATAEATGADAVVLATDGEPARSLSDQVMQRGIPHLFACVRDLLGVVGPFVLPGETACLRCVDAARSDLDPAWTTLLDSAAAKPPQVPAVDEAMAVLVAAWAVHEIALWASDVQPQTWGHVVEIPYGSGAVERIGYDRHPRCGCGWFGEEDTMGA
jgi:bacteriocin biosynthesis cyclodehydratase domain-containing protein